MKKKFVVICVVISFIFTFNAFADDANEMATPISIKLSPMRDLTSKARPTTPWKGIKAVWDGVVDNRADGEIVGYQYKKGKPTTPVKTGISLKQIFDENLKNVFSACGVQFVDKSDDEAMHLSAVIEKFTANADKKIFTGTAMAQSEICIIENADKATEKVTLTFQVENKGFNSKSVKKLTQTLNELLNVTFVDLPKQSVMNDLLRD